MKTVGTLSYLRLLLLSCVFFLLVPLTTHAALSNSGGRIVTALPGVFCSIPPGYISYYIPAPGSYAIGLYYAYGLTLTKTYGPPLLTGQQILAKTLISPSICWTPCVTGLCPTGIGNLMINQGTSLLGA